MTAIQPRLDAGAEPEVHERASLDVELFAQIRDGAARRDASAAITVDDAALLRQALRLGLAPERLVQSLATVDASLAVIAAAHHIGAARLAAVGRGVPAGTILATASASPDLPLDVLSHGEDALITGRARLSPGGALADRIVLDVPHGVSGPPGAPGAVALLRPGASGVRLQRLAPAFGQRAASDATIDLEAVAVPVSAPNVPPGDAQRSALALAELLHASLDAGILAGFLDAAREFLVTKARPWHEAGSETAAEDPHTIAVFGDAYAQLQALELLIDEASCALDEQASSAPVRPVIIARAYAAARVGGAVNRVIGVLGASGAAGGVGLDRYWRDARTHAVRQPALWNLDGRAAR